MLAMKINLHNQRSLAWCWQLGFWQLVTDLKSFLPFFLSFFLRFRCLHVLDVNRWFPLKTCYKCISIEAFIQSHPILYGCHFELNLKNDFLGKIHLHGCNYSSSSLKQRWFTSQILSWTMETGTKTCSSNRISDTQRLSFFPIWFVSFCNIEYQHGWIHFIA